MSIEPNLPDQGSRALVVENDPGDDVRVLGEWLRGAGLDLAVVRPHAGDPLPDSVDGYAAVIVLGGAQAAYPDADAVPGAPWFPALESLLRKAVRYRVPTLGVCLGAQLLAQALGGQVERSTAGPEIGARLVARRDVADRDPLFAGVPFAPVVVQWHHDEIVALPAGAVLLAASTRYPCQAFRIGPAAWGIQFHIECDTEMFATWAIDGVEVLLELGYDPVDVLAEVDRAIPEVAEVWRPFAERFAALVLERAAGQPGGQPGSQPGGQPPQPYQVQPHRPRQLPLLGG